MNITAIKATLQSASNIKKIRTAIHNVHVKGWSTDHVRHDNGSAFLAVRCHSKVLKITDKHGKDVTQMIVSVCKGTK